MNFLKKSDRLAAGAVAIFACLLAGCGGGSDAGGPAAAKDSAVQAAAGAVGTVAAPREVKIEVGDHMKFSVTRIEAAAGETLRVVLINTGRAPKEAMGHNWVLLKAGADATAYGNAAIGAKANDYIPAARADDVIAHTKLLGGGAKDAVVFTVPEVAAGTELVFLCTFPAHLQLGMKGVLVVK